MAYAYPKLRESLKKKILRGSKAGKPGEWNARKAQLLAREYRKEVADKYGKPPYKGKKSTSQKSLDKWTKEEWTTRDGKPAARKDKKGRPVMARYLPASAWEKLTPAEARATDRKKRRGKKQFVPNTKRAKKEGKSARIATAR